LDGDARRDLGRVRIIEAGDHRVNVNDPLGEYEMQDLNGQDRVTITGRIGTLRITGLNGHARLDASALTADRIVFAGPINGLVNVKVHAPGGEVTVSGTINGAPQIQVHAPGGVVTFAAQETAPAIQGDARVRVTARSVHLPGVIDGSARLIATLTTGGSLLVDELRGGSRCQWTKADADDPNPHVAVAKRAPGSRVEQQ